MILKAIGFIIVVAVVLLIVGYLVKHLSEDVEHLQKGVHADTNRDQTKRLRKQ